MQASGRLPLAGAYHAPGPRNGAQPLRKRHPGRLPCGISLWGRARGARLHPHLRLGREGPALARNTSDYVRTELCHRSAHWSGVHRPCSPKPDKPEAPCQTVQAHWPSPEEGLPRRAQGLHPHLRPQALRPERHTLDPLRARAARVEQLHPLALARKGDQRRRAALTAYASVARDNPTQLSPSNGSHSQGAHVARQQRSTATPPISGTDQRYSEGCYSSILFNLHP